MRVEIIGVNLPGRTFCRADGSPLDNVHVGVQIRQDPAEPVRADAAEAHWQLEVDTVATDDGVDFRGPAVHGTRGERFLYLTWGEVHADGTFRDVPSRHAHAPPHRARRHRVGPGLRFTSAPPSRGRSPDETRPLRSGLEIVLDFKFS